MNALSLNGYEAVPEPGILQPEKVDRILERCVGKQLSRLVEFADPNPRGGAQVGFLLRTHERPLYWAFPVPPLLEAAGYCAVWCPQWFPPQLITTRSMELEMTSERQGERFTANPLYRRLEGELIRGVRILEEPNHWGGQTLEFDITGASRVFRLLALAGRAHGLASRFTANYKIELPLSRPRVSVPGGPVIVRPIFVGTR